MRCSPISEHEETEKGAGEEEERNRGKHRKGVQSLGNLRACPVAERQN